MLNSRWRKEVSAEISDKISHDLCFLRAFDPLDLNPLLAYEAESSMVAPFEQPTLDLDPSDPSSLDIITATRAGVATYTDANGVVQSASPNTVRVDHVDGVPMILVEPAATNLVDYSNLDTSGTWISGGFDITQNAILSPDGLTNGTKLKQTSTTRNIYGSFISSAIETSVTYSFWVKKGSGSTHLNRFIIRNNNTSSDLIGGINLDTGEIIQNGFGTGNLIVESYPNGWFKVKATRDTGINTGDQIIIYPPYISSDGTNEINRYNYTFGHQLEYGSVATSYIPTSGSTVTRNADDLVIEGSDFTDFYNQSEGTFYVEFQTKDATAFYYLLNSQSSQARFFYSNSGTNIINSFDGTNFTRLYNLQNNTLSRVALSIKASEFRASKDGSSEDVASHNGNLLTVPTELRIGKSPYDQLPLQLNGHIKRLIYWPHHSDNL